MTFWANQPLFTTTDLIETLDDFFEDGGMKQIRFSLELKDGGIVIEVEGGFYLAAMDYKLPLNNGMKILGETILELSKMDKYDRVIEIGVFFESDIALDFMKPLLSDEFTALISMRDIGNQCTGQYCYGGIQYASTYNTLCEMISRDKIIVTVLGFTSWSSKPNISAEKSEIWDFKNNKFKINTSKLVNAIKSTNALKDIVLPHPNNKVKCDCSADKDYCGHYENDLYDYKLQELLKEALSLNFSVTSIIAYSKEILSTKTDMCISQKLLDQYLSWWPLLQKRNETAQSFNKILVGDEKDDGVWNESNCPRQIAQKLLKAHFPAIPSISFDKKGDICFCWKCHNLRKDKLIYFRGKPQKRYALPIGWVRFGLKTDEIKCIMNKVWEEWHVAFHGTTKEILPQIFKAGLLLLKPGDITIDGNKLGIRGGHIQKSFQRFNKYTKKQELFDPNQIYMSPSIKYSGHGSYAEWFYCTHPNDKNKIIKVQVAFQLRVRPNSYGIGQETVGAAQKGLALDINFSNNELEWYTQENVGIVLNGLLLRVKDVNKAPKSKIKK